MFWKRYLLGAALAVMSLQTLAAAPQVKTPRRVLSHHAGQL